MRFCCAPPGVAVSFTAPREAAFLILVYLKIKRVWGVETVSDWQWIFMSQRCRAGSCCSPEDCCPALTYLILTGNETIQSVYDSVEFEKTDRNGPETLRADQRWHTCISQSHYVFNGHARFAVCVQSQLGDNSYSISSSQKNKHRNHDWHLLEVTRYCS